MKKIISCFLFLCFAALSYAQNAELFLNNVVSYKPYVGDQIVVQTITVYLNACGKQPNVGFGDEEAKECAAQEQNAEFKNALNYDGSVFQIKLNNPGANAAALFFLSHGFGLKAYYNGDEIFGLMTRLQKTPNDENSAQVFKGIVDKVVGLPASASAVMPFNMRQIMTAQNTRSGFSPLHNIAFYTPSSKNTQDQKIVYKNMKSSFQGLLLEQFVTNEELKPYLCEAFKLQDNSKRNALNLAIERDNREAFLGLMLAASDGGCLADGKGAFLFQDKNASGLSVADMVKKHAAKNDNFYANAVTTVLSGGQSSDGGGVNQGQPPAQDQTKIKKEAEVKAKKATAWFETQGAGVNETAVSGNEQFKNNNKQKQPKKSSAAAVATVKPQQQANVPATQPTPKKLPVTPEILANAQAAVTDKQMQAAVKQLNRLDADKALGLTGKDEQRQYDQAQYIKTMRAKGSPFARFDDKDKNKNMEVVMAYTDAVKNYRDVHPTEDGLDEKLAQCDNLSAQWKKNPKKFNTYGSGLEELQYEIIEASGNKYISRACFDSLRKNGAASVTTPPKEKEIEELTPVTKNGGGAQQQKEKETEALTLATKNGGAQPKSAVNQTQSSGQNLYNLYLEGLTEKLPLKKNRNPGPTPAGSNDINEQSLAAYYGKDNFSLIQWRLQQLASVRDDINSTPQGQSNTPELSQKQDTLQKGLAGVKKDINNIKLNPSFATLYYQQIIPGSMEPTR